jgi:hypothetical protein
MKNAQRGRMKFFTLGNCLPSRSVLDSLGQLPPPFAVS